MQDQGEREKGVLCWKKVNIILTVFTNADLTEGDVQWREKCDNYKLVRYLWETG